MGHRVIYNHLRKDKWLLLRAPAGKVDNSVSSHHYPIRNTPVSHAGTTAGTVCRGFTKLRVNIAHSSFKCQSKKECYMHTCAHTETHANTGTHTCTDCSYSLLTFIHFFLFSFPPTLKILSFVLHFLFLSNPNLCLSKAKQLKLICDNNS